MKDFSITSPVEIQAFSEEFDAARKEVKLAIDIISNRLADVLVQAS